MLRIGGPLVAFALLAGPALPQNRTEQLRARWEQETDAFHKAKIMTKLGDAEFQDISREAAAEDFPAALAGFQQYRDEARRSVEALDAKSLNAEKHPAGFKQLQISVRESLRRINELIAGLTADQQEPFLAVRKDLEELNRRLIHELFPGLPAGDAPPG
ncbi:MAG: hypothetical protein WA405_02665 [Candidatus Acidiferrales bacterium]